jgi:hypothetical protein
MQARHMSLAMNSSRSRRLRPNQKKNVSFRQECVK